MALQDAKLDDLLTGDPPRLEPLLRWLLEASPVHALDGEPRRTTRLRRLQAALLERGLTSRLSEAWNHTSAIRLLAETGLPDRTSLVGEGFLRVVDRVIPRLDPEGDLYALLDRLELNDADALWIEGLPEDLRTYWGSLCSPPLEAWVQAARLLAHRTAAVGLSRDLLSLDPGGSDADSPFFNLSRAVRERGERPRDAEARIAWEHCRAECCRALDQAHDRIEDSGVSTDLVFRLELLEAQLARIAQLLEFVSGDGDGMAFTAELVRGSASQHGLVSLLRTVVKRLARKVVEHTGDTGEHYIARNRREWWGMAWSAVGGGVLTTATALMKFALLALPVAPLLKGLSLASNYTFSFFILQLMGFTLASKQPAMTAAALAQALEAGEDQAREIDLVAAITRTQVIATLGNVLAAILAAFGITALWTSLTGHGPLNAEAALYTIQSNHPFQGRTLVFATVTGILLWLSSLATGWAANWSTYRRLPEAVAQSHRVRALLGASRAKALGRLVHRNISGFIGNLILAGLLVFVPMGFAFAGIRLEAYHVTLQSASLAFSSASLYAMGSLPWADVLWSLLGLAFIGILNFTVSFALALWTALRARGLSGRASRHLGWGILRAFNRQPGRFLWATKTRGPTVPLAPGERTGNLGAVERPH